MIQLDFENSSFHILTFYYFTQFSSFSNTAPKSILSLYMFEDCFKTSFSHHLHKEITFSETGFSSWILESIKMERENAFFFICKNWNDVKYKMLLFSATSVRQDLY